MNASRTIVLKSIADVAARGTTVISFPIIARYAGPDGYGAYGQLMTIVGLITPFASLGVTGAVVRYFVGGTWSQVMATRIRTIATFLLATSIAVGGCLFVGAHWVGELLLDWPQSAALFRVGAALIVVGTLELFLLEILRARGWLNQYVFLQLAETLSIVGAIGVLLPMGRGIVDLAVAIVVIKALLILIGASFVMTRQREDTPDEAPAPHIPQLIRFGLPLTISGVGLVLVNVGDRAVIGHFLEADALGRYSAVYVLASLLTLTGGPFFLPVYPRLMNATLADRPDVVAEDIRLFHRYLTLALVPTAIFLGVIIQPSLLLLGGAEFRVAAPVIFLIVGGVFVDQWNGLAHYVLMCHDKTTLLRNAWLGFGVLNVLVNILVVPVFGLPGAAVVTLGTFLGLNIIIFRVADRFVPLKDLYQWTTLAHSAAAGAAGAAGAKAVHMSTSTPFVEVVTGAVVFWGVCVGLLVLFHQLGRSDLQILRSAFVGSKTGPPAPERYVD